MEISVEAKKPIKDIHDAGKQLLALVNDIFDLSKIESGRGEIRADVVDVGRLCEEATALVKTMARRRNVRFENSTPLGRFLCRGDEDRVRQVLANLFSNAVKFTAESSSVVIKVEPQDDFIRVSVCDEGVGIDEQDFPRLF